jgi:dolichol kinase
MAFNFFTLPITIFFIVNGVAQLYYAIRLRKKFSQKHNFQNSILVFFLWILAGVLYPFFYIRDSFHVRWFQALSMQIICIYAPLLIFAILFYQYQFVVKKNRKLKLERTIEAFQKKMISLYNEKSNNKNYPLITDLHRKAFHLIPAAVIIFLWFFAIYIWDGIWNADLFWGITGEEYGNFLILTVGYAGIIIFAALDYIRLSYIFENKSIYHLMPKSISNLLVKTLKPNEIYEFTKPVALVLSFVPIFFLPVSIFSAAALISSLGDAAASIFGICFGKRKFPRSSKKTIIGYIAGFSSSFGCSLLALWIFEPFLPLIKVIIIALGGAMVFLIVDLMSLKVDDNILNPIFCGLVMLLLYLYI